MALACWDRTYLTAAGNGDIGFRCVSACCTDIKLCGHSHVCQDVVSCRAVWDPCMSCSDDLEAYKLILTHALAVFGPATPGVVTAIVDLSQTQRDLLVRGLQANGSLPSDIVKHNGQAYLEGWDTWAELGVLTPHTLDTQPNKYSLAQVREPAVSAIYWTTVGPLLTRTNASFAAALDQFGAIASSVPKIAQPIYQ